MYAFLCYLDCFLCLRHNGDQLELFAQHMCILAHALQFQQPQITLLNVFLEHGNVSSIVSDALTSAGH